MYWLVKYVGIQRKINIKISKISIINNRKREKDHGHNYPSYRKCR